jgi:hypothetical protein
MIVALNSKFDIHIRETGLIPPLIPRYLRLRLITVKVDLIRHCCQETSVYFLLFVFVNTEKKIYYLTVSVANFTLSWITFRFWKRTKVKYEYDSFEEHYQIILAYTTTFWKGGLFLFWDLWIQYFKQILKKTKQTNKQTNKKKTNKQTKKKKNDFVLCCLNSRIAQWCFAYVKIQLL